jgi:hypothetical protein
MGGKNTNIDGFMPKTISHDGGKTWDQPTKTPFAALASNQRPTILRLASGRLFFASDFQSREGRQPEGIKEHGSFVALSSDEGKTWHVKNLITALPHEAHILEKGRHGDYGGFGTLGYTIATQGANGLIHLITSMNFPSQEFEMNESWILSDAEPKTPNATSPGKEIRGEQHFPDGKLQASWTGKIDSNGNYELWGPETWYAPSGAKQYEVNSQHGRKTGTETYWTSDGRKAWEWQRDPEGNGTWTQYWPNGKKKSESTWQGGRCAGQATSWLPSGEVARTYEFKDGMLVH